MDSTHPTTRETEPARVSAPPRTRYNFTLSDLMLTVLLFGAKLSATRWWLDPTHSSRPDMVILPAVVSGLASAGSLLFVSSTPHGRKTWPLRWMFMISLDGALFIGIPCLVMLVPILVLFAPITVPAWMAFMRFWKHHEKAVTRDVGEAIEAPEDPRENADV